MGQTTAAGPGSGGPAGPDSAGPDSAGPDSAETEKDRVVELLGSEWSIIISLLAGLDDAAWSRPALPGWDVHDVLAHLIGTERTLAGEQHPDPADIDAGRHVRNAIGKANEAWVLALRDRPHASLLDDFRSVTAHRLASLRAMSPEEFNAPSWTPAGQATYARFMRIRIFDCWMHEQDIRTAVGIP
ncbi:MAG TPA: maleylpyruvate isomerase family mycothiol-dependent enzyme, partial [Streptosporangiaceae bacterium]